MATKAPQNSASALNDGPAYGGPSQMPPTLSADKTATVMDAPRDLTMAEMALSVRGAAADAVPTLMPPALADGAEAREVMAWQNNAHITALWSVNQSRNAAVYIQNVGWKKLSTASDSAEVALNALASSAKQTNANVSYREEADGMIHEIYVW